MWLLFPFGLHYCHNQAPSNQNIQRLQVNQYPTNNRNSKYSYQSTVKIKASSQISYAMLYRIYSTISRDPKLWTCRLGITRTKNKSKTPSYKLRPIHYYKTELLTTEMVYRAEKPRQVFCWALSLSFKTTETRSRNKSISWLQIEYELNVWLSKLS